MKDILVLRELDQIKAISHDYRLMIIEAFDDKPCTAKMISDKIKEPHAKVNYHIKTMEKVGLLELVEENVKLGIVEKYYAPVAKQYVVDSSVMNTKDANVADSLNRVFITFFEKISKDFYESIENPHKDHTKKLFFKSDVYLTNEESRELSDQISKVIEEYIEDKTDAREDTEKYLIGNLVIPKATDSESEE